VSKNVSLLLVLLALTASCLVPLFSLATTAKAQPPDLPPLPDLDEEQPPRIDLDPEELRELFEKAKPYHPPPPELTEQEKVLRDKALSFLIDVAKLDTSSYNVEVFLGPLVPNCDKSLKFKFSSDESKIDATCHFNGASLFCCMIYPLHDSSVVTTQKSSDVLTTAKDTLASLQAFSAKGYLPTMRSMLNSVTELKSSKITADGFTQEIAVSENTVRISWAPYANDLSNSKSVLILEFENGHLMFFCNHLDIYAIGSTEVKISEQEAICIATEHARAYSWEAGNETVSNVNVIDSPVIANLSLQNRGNNTLYPYWNVWLPLDKMYPGGVTAFHVTLWADTEEVSFISPIGYYGDPKANPSQPQAPYVLAIATTLTAATIVIASYIVYKKRKITKT
jgi:hypothetical protein